jgi:flagellar motor switch protein FliG
LRQVLFSDEVEMEISEGRITLRRIVDPAFVPDFSAIAGLDDASIQALLRKVSGRDLVTALVGAEAAVKTAILRNLSPRVRAYVEPTVARLERSDARELIIEQSRNALCEALMEVAKG